MKLVVIGAAGRTGSATVREALGRGHHVVAVARHDVSDLPEGAELRIADARDPQAITSALAGAAAVISAVGIGNSRGETDVYSEGARVTMEAMEALGIARLVAVSGAPAGPRAHHPGLKMAAALSLLEFFFGASYRDMRRMEEVLAGSAMNWLVVRPPRLVAKPARGVYRAGALPAPNGPAITIDDLAVALVDYAEQTTPNGCVYISN
jgi:putative NADH-flavin reductase